MSFKLHAECAIFTTKQWTYATGRKNLCDKCDSYLFLKDFPSIKLNLSLNISFCKNPKTLIVSVDHDKTRK